MNGETDSLTKTALICFSSLWIFLSSRWTLSLSVKLLVPWECQLVEILCVSKVLQLFIYTYLMYLTISTEGVFYEMRKMLFL